MDKTDFIKAREQRRRKRQQKRRRFYFFLVLIIIIFALILIIANEDKLVNPNKSNSSQAVEVIYPEKPQEISDLLVAINKKDGIKTCYLTFDDGPTKSVTPRILDTLRKYNAKATFFTVGTLVEANKDVARRAHDEGHLVANHSYSHNYSDFYATEESFMSEIDKVYSIISSVTGNENPHKIFRFPGGGFNTGSLGETKQNYKLILNQKGIRYCDWNALNGDAEGGSPTVDQLVARVKKTTNGKEDVVILMHDAAAKSTTADALPQILEYLNNEGYVFKRLDQAPRF